MDLNRKHGGDVYGITKLHNIPIASLLDFSASINPLGPPASIFDQLDSSFDNIQHYPDIASISLTNSIAQSYNISHKNILIGNGSIEFLYILPQALKTRKIATLSPSFCEYGALSEQLGIEEVQLKLEPPFELSSKIVIEFIKKQKSPIDIFYICNPNNPTGNILQKDDILEISSYMKHGYLIIDEAFVDFCPEFSILTENNPRIIVLRSFTKFFSIPALRLGFLKAEEKVINMVKKWQPPWSVNHFSQKAGYLALEDKNFIQNSIDFVKKESRFLYENLHQIEGITAYPTNANFVLAHMDRKCVKDLYENLLKSKILIRNCQNMGLNNYFRVAVKTREHNLVFINNLRNFFKKK